MLQEQIGCLTGFDRENGPNTVNNSNNCRVRKVISEKSIWELPYQSMRLNEIDNYTSGRQQVRRVMYEHLQQTVLLFVPLSSQVSEVLESKNSSYPPGSHVLACVALMVRLAGKAHRHPPPVVDIL